MQLNVTTRAARFYLNYLLPTDACIPLGQWKYLWNGEAFLCAVKVQIKKTTNCALFNINDVNSIQYP